MKTKNIFKTLAFAMMMPAMLLTTACSSEDELANNKNIDNTETAINKGYELPVTVNVTRQGDSDMRATYNESTRKLEFSAGDKLFVEGSHEKADRFAGTLTWQSGGTFSGTIYTESPYEGTIDDLLNGNYATLLPAGYESYDYLEIMYEGYEARLGENAYNSFATSKKLGVEQLSFEHGEYTSGTGFELEPQKAILNFTITGLTSNTKVTATLSDDEVWTPDIEGEVTTDGSGNATFAIGLDDSSDLNEYSLSVAGNAITLVSSSKVLAAGKIYNINRSASAPLPAVFTVDAGKTVKFSKGNLQATYNGSSWIWGFAEHQWDYIGNAAGNTSINGNGTVSANGTVDLFGWVGASSTWTGAAQYGISNSIATNNVDGYGNVGGEAQKVGWGATVGTGWRTLTRPEWLYLLSTRETGVTVNSTNHARYTMAIINTDGTAVKGLIIFPDSYAGGSPAGVTWGTINAKSTFETTCTSAGWTALEAAGCVFLPAAGYREASTVTDAGVGAGYWSSSSSNAPYAFGLYFESNYMTIQYGGSRKYGFSVRLVRDAD
jgi:uncharacterized protein YfiM (DUF2279 family)